MRANGAGYDVAIVGGGNLGLWTARSLTRRGVRRVAVLDRGWLGYGATARSAGMIRAQGGTTTAVLLGLRSRALYQQLGAEIGLDDGFTRTGYYVLADSPEEADHFRDLVELRRRLGGYGEWLDTGEGQHRIPWLDWSTFAGATFDPDDGYVHPPIAARNITIAVGRASGVDLFEHCEVVELQPGPAGWIVRHARGYLAAERVVLAGGAAGSRLGEMVGLKLPVAGHRHHIVVYATVGAGMPRPFPQIFAVGRGFYLRPEEEGALVGLSRSEQPLTGGSIALPLDQPFVAARLAEVEELAPGLAGQPLSRIWAAAVDHTPDALPVVDEAAPGCVVVAGGGHGMMWGPALGEATAELLVAGTRSGLPPDEIGLARFQANRPATSEPISLKPPLA